jgi:hypothetical protein
MLVRWRIINLAQLDTPVYKFIQEPFMPRNAQINATPSTKTRMMTIKDKKGSKEASRMLNMFNNLRKKEGKDGTLFRRSLVRLPGSHRSHLAFSHLHYCRKLPQC